MHVFQRDERYFVLSREGKLSEFKDYLALLDWLKTNYYWRHQWRREGAVEKVSEVGHNWNENCKYIVFDSMNRVISASMLAADVKKSEEREDEERANRNHRRRNTYFRGRQNWLGFRNGPVPYVGYGNKARGSGFKRMRTTQELRRNSWDFMYARTRRTKRYLPNHWDDHRSRRPYKSWKSQKKRKQWM